MANFDRIKIKELKKKEITFSGINFLRSHNFSFAEVLENGVSVSISCFKFT